MLSAPKLNTIFDDNGVKPKRVKYPTQPAASKKAKKVTQQLQKLGVKPLKVPAVVDCDGVAGRWVLDKTPCLTATRGAGGGYWVTCMNRRLTTSELFKLQGMDPQALHIPPEVSDRKLGHMIGNAVTQTVIERLAANLLKSVGCT